MARVEVALSVSLDGFFARPDGALDWHRVDDELHSAFNEHSATLSAFLTGRVMYELMEDYWPTADEDPDASEPEVEFAQIWRDTPKVVYSRTLASVGPNATLVRDVVPAEVRALPGTVGVGGGGRGRPSRRRSSSWAWSTSTGCTSTPWCWARDDRCSPARCRWSCWRRRRSATAW